jgi:hypothetical protein
VIPCFLVEVSVEDVDYVHDPDSIFAITIILTDAHRLSIHGLRSFQQLSGQYDAAPSLNSPANNQSGSVQYGVFTRYFSSTLTSSAISSRRLPLPNAG